MKTRHPTTSLLRTYIHPKTKADGKRSYEVSLTVSDTEARFTSTRKTAKAAVRAARIKAGVAR